MTAHGFLEQKNGSPVGFGTVVLLHGAAIAALVMLKGPGFIIEPPTDTKAFQIEKEAPPPENPPLPPPQTEVRTPPPRSVIEAPLQIVRTPAPGPTLAAERNDAPPGPTVGTGTQATPERGLVAVPPRDPPRAPVRVAALFDPRYAASQQPPYPSSEERAEREGQVRVRVTIAPDGRVTAAERVSATNDAFWRATERQALTRWRFRPATEDGRAIVGSTVITIHFRLDGR